MSFERDGKRVPLLNGESENGIWLRLHNNTTWAIILQMNDVPSKKYGDVDLFYEVLSGASVVVDLRCHVCSVNKVAPGRSLAFSLPREYLMGKERSIRIGFNYEWEQDKTGSTTLEPEHYVYFYSSQLPKNVQEESQ